MSKGKSRPDAENETVARTAFDEFGGTFGGLEPNLRSNGKLFGKKAVGTCRHGHPVEATIGYLRSGRSLTCWTCREAEWERLGREAFDEFGGTFEGLEQYHNSDGKPFGKKAVGACGNGHHVEIRIGHLRIGNKLICETCREAEWEKTGREAFDEFGGTFGGIATGAAREKMAAGTCRNGHPVEASISNLRAGNSLTCWTCREAEWERLGREAFDKFGGTFGGIAPYRNSDGNGFGKKVVGTCQHGHPVETQVGHLRKGKNPVCWTCQESEWEKIGREAFDELGGTFDGLVPCFKQSGVASGRKVVGVCKHGHPVEARIGDLRAGNKLLCRICREAEWERIGREAFDEFGGTFLDLEPHRNSDGKLFGKKAVGTCAYGHPVESAIGELRKDRPLFCRTCFEAGRRGVVYLAATPEAAYVGKTVALYGRLTGHFDGGMESSGPIFEQLLPADKAFLGGSIIPPGYGDAFWGTHHESTVRRARFQPIKPREAFFAILEQPEDLAKAEKRWIKWLASQGIPLRNMQHNPQYNRTTKEYAWPEVDYHVGHHASLLIAAGDIFDDISLDESASSV